MIIGFALVLTLLQVRASFAVPLTQLQADLNNLERSVDELQNYFHEVCHSCSTQHLPWYIQPSLIPSCEPHPNPCTLRLGFQSLDWFFSTNLLVSTKWYLNTTVTTPQTPNSISSGMCSSPVFLSTTTLQILLSLIHS